MRDSDIRKAPAGVRLQDTVIKHLWVRTFAGRKSFYFRFSLNNKPYEPKIGDWPVPFSLADARAIAKDWLFEVANGRHPQAERKAARTAPTVKDLCERYWDEKASSQKSARDVEGLMRIHILPKLGRERVADLDYDMIYEWHRSIGGVRSNRALARLSVMLTFAERWGWRPMRSNPCSLIQRQPEKARRRYITDPEAVRIEAELKKLEATRPQSVAFIYLLIYTGARSGEIAAAKWSDLDGDILTLPPEKHKTGMGKTGVTIIRAEPRIIHLNEEAMEVLERLPRGSGTITGIKSPGSAWQLVRTAAGCPDLRIHDLRHNFASDAVAAGLSLTQIGGALGHKQASTTMRYAHLMEEAGRKTAAMTGQEIKRRLKRRLKG